LESGPQKSASSLQLLAFTFLLAAFVLPTLSTLAAAKSNATPKAAAARAEAAPVELTPPVIPPSVFEIPRTKKDGRDPFFPDSDRPFGTVSVTRTNPQSGAVSLALKALAGQATKRFATISAVGGVGGTRSILLEQGQEDELVTPTGRIKIRCLEIKEDAAIVEVNGTRRELRLRSGF
jgi:hypothetical protein